MNIISFHKKKLKNYIWIYFHSTKYVCVSIKFQIQGGIKEVLTNINIKEMGPKSRRNQGACKEVAKATLSVPHIGGNQSYNLKPYFRSLCHFSNIQENSIKTKRWELCSRQRHLPKYKFSSSCKLRRSSGKIPPSQQNWSALNQSKR